MPVNITDVDAFTDPITAPAGGDVRNSASVVAVAQKLANRTRNLKNRLDALFDVANELVYPSGAQTRTIWIPPSGFTWSNQDVLGGSRPDQWGIRQGGGPMLSFVNLGLAICPINAFVPDGVTIVSFHVLVDPGVARATSGNRMRVSVLETKYSGSSAPATALLIDPSSDTTAVDDGTTNRQLIGKGSLSYTFRKTVDQSVLEFLVLAGNDAATNIDSILGARVTCSQPGIRGY
jgi:hypothetical protein